MNVCSACLFWILITYKRFSFQFYADYINESALKYAGSQNANAAGHGGGGGLLSGIGKLFGWNNSFLLFSLKKKDFCNFQKSAILNR